MVMDLNDYGEFANACKQSTELVHKHKFEEKNLHNLGAMDHIMNRKDPEYIDHSLLAPEYMRDSNHFIMDLMSFPKAVDATNTSDVNTTSTMNTDLEFHNALFHSNNTRPESDHNHRENQQPTAHDPQKAVVETRNVYIPLNGDFMIPVSKPYNGNTVDDTVADVVDNNVKVVQQLILTDTNEALDDISIDDSCDVSRFNARKVLPHKKRISRKLKISNEDDPSMPLSVSMEGEQQHKITHVAQIQIPTFRCELCGHGSCSQIEFFSHLKQHYEPSTSYTILAAMKNSLDELEPQKSTAETDICTIDKKTDGLDQVFQDVHFPFENFPQNEQDMNSVRTVMVDAHPQATSHSHPIEHINMNITSPAIQQNETTVSVPRTSQPPQQVGAVTLTPDEFSDTEDMLEGIRDKVFIEDTCDTMDLMTPTSNSVRRHWFNTTNFSSMELKIKPFCDVLFPSQFPPILQSESPTCQELTNNGNCITCNGGGGESNEVGKLNEQQNNVKEIVNSPALPLSKPIKNVSLDIPTENNVIDRCILISEAECQIKKQTLKETNNTTLENCILLSCEETFSATEPLSNDVNTEENCHNLSYNAPMDDGAANKLDLPLDYGDIISTDVTNADQSEKILEDDYNEETIDKTECDMMSRVENERKRYMCTNCNRIFNSCNALKYHNRTHLGFRPHKCDICNKSFFAISALKTHIRTHTGDKPFECVHCDRKFRQWGDLKYHIVSIHSNEKNHQCEFCGKAFSRKYSLVVHLRIHTSERNYKCEFCSKSFRASTYLQNHRKIHTGEKPYECDRCAKRFRVSGDLRRHQRIHERKTASVNIPVTC